MNCLQTYQLNKSISQLITNSGLSVNEIYWVLKDIYKEVEQLYFEEVKKEIELEKEKSE